MKPCNPLSPTPGKAAGPGEVQAWAEGEKTRVQKILQSPGHRIWEGIEKVVNSRLVGWANVSGWFGGAALKQEVAYDCVCRRPCAPVDSEWKMEKKS